MPNRITSKVTIVFLLLISCFSVSASNPKDSLLRLVRIAKMDTLSVKLFLSCSRKSDLFGKDSTYLFALKAREVAKKTKNKKFIIRTLQRLVDYNYSNLSNYLHAKLYLDTLKPYVKDMTNVQKCNYYSRWGDVVYYDLDYAKSIEYYFNALEFAGTDSIMLARLNHNLAWVYADYDNFNEAVKFGKKSIDLYEKIGDSGSMKHEILIYVYNAAGNYPMALYYINLDKNGLEENDYSYFYYRKASIYLSMMKYDSAIFFAEKGFDFAIKNDQQKYKEYNLTTILKAGFHSKQFVDFKKYFYEYLRINNTPEQEQSLSWAYLGVGSYFMENNKLDSAAKYLNASLRLHIKYDYERIELGKTYKLLAILYEKKGNYKLSNSYFQQYLVYVDSLKRVDSLNAIKIIDEKLKTFQVKEKLAVRESEIAKQDLQLKTEKYQKYGAGIAVLIMFLIAGIILKNLRIRNKLNAELSLQKDKVEEKQREILDSISYARRIQAAILPSIDAVKTTFPESFILYLPKDIVAGDFYWMEKIEIELGDGTKEECIYIAAADCTGHGVPGAMVSVVCSNALNRVVSELKISDPGEMLNKVSEIIIETLDKSGEQVKDGMDISLLVLKKQKKSNKYHEVLWSGANNPLWFVHEGVFNEIRGDKRPVGNHLAQSLFTTHRLEPKDGTQFYLITDGFADQFGGNDGKKLMKKKLKEILQEMALKSQEEQHETLNTFFDTWRGNRKQIDDVTVIGIRI